MKKYYSLLVISVVTFMLLTGCSGVTIKPGSAIILTAGYYQDNNLNMRVPCLWELNIRTDLPIPSNRGEAYSVFYYQYNFYIAGYFYDKHKNKEIPSCWISKSQPNTSGIQWDRIDLDGGASDGRATSIYMSNNPLYLAGYYDDSSVSSVDDGKPCYWTIPNLGTGNSTRTDLPTKTNTNGITASGRANSIYVSGNIVYTAGYYFSSSTARIPCYWAGADKTDLVSAEGRATSIYVSNKSIYVAGYYDGSPDNGKPCYWTIPNLGTGNPTRTDLPTITNTNGTTALGRANSIYVSGSTVYTAGSYAEGYYHAACYWTNTKKTILASIGSTSGIYVNGNTVYTSGSFGSPEFIYIPCYWIDDTKRVNIELPDEHDLFGEVRSIFGIPMN